MRLVHSFFFLTTISTACVAAEPSHPVEARTVEAVAAADEAWGAAEQRGDAVYVDWLLAPGYVSVGHDGAVHPKAAIVAHTRERTGSNLQAAAAKIAAWRSEHPSRTSVKIFGDTAIVSFISTKADAGEPVNSSDVFVYTGGHWHPIYSHHSSAGF